VSLQQARRKRDKARVQLVDGIDPVEEKRQRRLEAELAAKTTLQLVAEEYIQKMEREGKSSATLKKARWFLELLAAIANRPIASVTPHELLDVLKRFERRGHHETALRLRSFAGRVFRYGFAIADRAQSGGYPPRRAHGPKGQKPCCDHRTEEGRRAVARDRRL